MPHMAKGHVVSRFVAFHWQGRHGLEACSLPFECRRGTKPPRLIANNGKMENGI